jgi:hypothetical protein
MNVNMGTSLEHPVSARVAGEIAQEGNHDIPDMSHDVMVLDCDDLVQLLVFTEEMPHSLM